MCSHVIGGRMCLHGIPCILENPRVNRLVFSLCTKKSPRREGQKVAFCSGFENRQFLGQRPGANDFRTVFGDAIKSAQTSVSSSGSASSSASSATHAFWTTWEVSPLIEEILSPQKGVTLIVTSHFQNVSLLPKM